ncbi:hypothetical protein Lser_V15G02571 [Lactuca serriola]
MGLEKRKTNNVYVRSLVITTSSSSSQSLMSNSRSTKKIFDDANSCGFRRPFKFWTFRMEDHPEIMFKACPNRWIQNIIGLFERFENFVGLISHFPIGKRIVAVKKLNTVVQDGEKEFKTEVDAIARTHQKNLVHLLGYCDGGEQWVLVYIAVRIGKGLAYLHEECSIQIIHCDIKPQNILLDDYFNAKISDFGLAKLLMMNQIHTNTGIRGTKGYVAPEWFRNMPVTVKVDVYSFGVLLLEIISCRKSLAFESDNEGMAVLTDLAWDCNQEGRLDALVGNNLEALNMEIMGFSLSIHLIQSYRFFFFFFVFHNP